MCAAFGQGQRRCAMHACVLTSMNRVMQQLTKTICPCATKASCPYASAAAGSLLAPRALHVARHTDEMNKQHHLNQAQCIPDRV